MHERTFVGAADTLKQIQANFNPMDDGAKTQPAKTADNTIGASAAAAPEQLTLTNTPAHSLEEISDSIRQLLAQELHMRPSDIDEETPFVDLGLDSITGVTWMRKINDRYRTSIQATKVYSHSTLVKLSAYVKEEIERLDASAPQAPAVAAQAETPKQVQVQLDLVDDSVKTQAVKPAPVSIVVQELDTVASVANVASAPAHSQSEIAATIKQLLAQELHMQVSDIDEETSFVDLGLDSITGVTWMRKINDRYRTSIQATKVYSHSTVVRLSAYIQEEIERLGPPSGQATPSKTVALNGPAPVSVSISAPVAVSAPAPVASTSAHSLQEITTSLKQLLAQELHMQADDIDEETSFVDLGLDSITGVTWMRKINERYRTSIQATKVYSHPTLAKLSVYVKEEIERLGPANAPATPSKPVVLESAPVAPKAAAAPTPVAAAPQPAKTGSPLARKSRSKLASWRDQKSSRLGSAPSPARPSAEIAVIGMAGQFPKATSLEQYWDNVAQGRNCISEIPKERWDLDTYFQEGDPTPGKTNAKWMGCLDEYDLFDPLFFDISPKEAISMDPQQRIFIQTCWKTIENAGYNPRSLSGSKCGVFAGCGPGDYHLLSRDLQINALGFTGNDTSILAARVSYFLNLQGPCLSIETACSSSLVAIATACDSLIAGNSDVALAGGVGLIVGPELHIKMAQTGMMSQDGRCFTFDQRANGFAPGEGVGAVMLKRLADAERDQDMILGVIHGWGVNQDGKTNGITAPNPDSQTRLQQDVYDKFEIDPTSIQLIEAHGTGTKLGDPIEVDALQQTFKKYTKKKGYCALGSVKSNIGHCFTAAGVASVIKVLLALKHKQLPPTINFAKLNEHISLKDSPFYVNDRLQAWELQGAERRRAAISAFGFGGTNAHVVISEYTAPARAASSIAALSENGKYIIPLSAKREEQLKQKVADLLEFISKKGRSVDLVSLAYTLQVGREAMDERLGFMAGSIDELAEKLRAYLAGEHVGDMYQGRARDHKEAMSFLRRDADMRETIVDKLIAQRSLSKLLDLWIKDLQFDWNKLYGNAKPQRIDVPTYPFAKERYWIDTAQAAKQVKTVTVSSSALHPLLHRNTSNLRQLSYSSAFRGDESFLENHPSDGVKVLPGSACLEMARVAVAQATSTPPEAAHVELHDVVWGQPFVAANGKDVTIALFANDDESIDFEIYSKDQDEVTVHCQGQAVLAASANFVPLVEVSIPQLTPPVLQEVQAPVEIISQAQLQQELKESLAEALFMAVADIRVDKPFIELGLDSIVGVEWISAVNKKYNVKITATKVYDYPNITEFASYLRQEIEKASPPAPKAVSAPVVQLQSAPVVTPAPLPAIPQEAPAATISPAQLQQELKESLANALFLKASDIRVDKPFIELGLDSIVGVEWINEINKQYKVKITATKVYDYPNITEFASFLKQEIEKASPPAPKAVSAPAAQPQSSSVVTPAPLPAIPQAAPAAAVSAAQLQQELKESLANALFLKASDIRVDKPFIELGLDSIVGVEWINEINKQYKVKITATKVYDYPNIVEFASFLKQEIEKSAPPSPKPVSPAVAPAAAPAVMAPPPAPVISYEAPAEVISAAQLQQELKESLANALFMKASDIRVDKPFIELGLDSIVGVEWINEINKQYKVKITATKVYDYPNIVEFASFLRKEIEKTAPAVPRQQHAAPVQPVAAPAAVAKPVVNVEPAQAKPAERLAPLSRKSYSSLTRSAGVREPVSAAPAPTDDRIAVIGMSGRYPQAKDLKQFWENLAQGKDCITEMPPSRWDVNQYYDPDPKKEDKIYCKWIGMLDDIEYFDPLFFKISPAEAKNMDPQHRMLLEEAYTAFENAGYSNKALSNKKCGVYVGIIGTEYAALVSNADDITGNNPAIGAARIAYFLNLKGPAISIDTACSASLVAVHLACQGLLRHETDMALAGGVTIWINPEPYAGMCRAGMLSPDGRCKTFDNSANGFVPGEGAGAVVLKRLADAERDNDFIYGVILGSGINQDGKTNGITAPSANSQMELERGLYAKYGIDPETISYVETHGTGTKLGDPIEFDALSTVFKEKTSKKNFCGLGSVKSNIGHTSGAAGVASLQKVLLCMKHRTLVPTLNVTKENSLFDFKDSPFYVVKEARPWDVAPGTLRRAAVSSFGFSGTNAHLVVEEYVVPAEKHAVAGDVVIPLSARTAGQLQQRAQDMLKFIREDRTRSTDLVSLAYTLVVGKEAMDERLGFIVNSVDQLAASLEAYLGGDLKNVFRGKVERSEDGVIVLSQQPGIDAAVDQCLANRDFSKLMALWVKGLDLEWNKLYGEVKPRRIALPTYPFAKKHCWVDTVKNEGAVEVRTVAAALHPLVHRNISVLGQQRYSATFSGDESFLIKHADQAVLPAAAYLEMVRVAVENAAPAPRASLHLSLRQLTWGRPLVAAKDRQVNIALFNKTDEQIDFEVYSSGHGPQNHAEEIVHCQGHAVLIDQPAHAKLDVEKLKKQMAQASIAVDSEAVESLYLGDGQLLAQLRLPAAFEAGLNDYVLHPQLVDGVLHAAMGLMQRSSQRPQHFSLPFAIESIQIESGCTKQMFAWVRQAQLSQARDKVIKLDIDVCDQQGRVCVQLRGVAYDAVPVSDARPIAKVSASPIALAERHGIALADPQPQPSAKAAAKPQISLQ